MRKALLLIFVVAWFFSCSNFMYYPNNSNTPLLKEKNETKISVGLKGYQGYLNAAYAIGNHFAVQSNTNAMYLKVKEPGEDQNYINGNLYTEIAPGLYFPFVDYLVAEVYAGAGLGVTSSYHVETETITQRHYRKTFVQGNFGLRGQNITGGISLKESLVLVYREKMDDALSTNSYLDLFFEPTVFFAFGAQEHKILIQAGISYSHYAAITYPPFIVSLGYEYAFSLTK